MTTTAGPPGTNMGSPPQTDASQSGRQAAKSASPTDPIAVAKERERVLTERKNAPRNENVFIPVTEGGLGHNNQFARYLFERSLRKHDPRAMPKLSQIEVAAFDAYWRRREQDAIDEIEAAEPSRKILRLQLLVNCGAQGIVHVVNGKSVGKSTITLLASLMIRRYTGRHIIAMPSTKNNKNATLGSMAGIGPDEELTIERLSQIVRTQTWYAEQEMLIPTTHKDHVGIISKDKGNPSIKSRFELDDLIACYFGVRPNCSFLFGDGGNDNIEEGSLAVASMRFAHLPVFVYDPHDAYATETCFEDVAAYRQDDASGEKLNLDSYRATDFDEMDRRIALTGLGIDTPTKVAHSVVVANRTKAVDTDEVMHYMRTPQSTSEKPMLPWQGRAVAIPFDEYIGHKDGKGRGNPIDLDLIDPATFNGALDLAVAICEQLAVIRQLDVPSTHRDKPTPEVDYTK